MPWITTKTGKRINTDWFDDDEANKQRQMDANKKEADKKNSISSTLADKYSKIKDEDELRKMMHDDLIPKDSFVNSKEYKEALDDIHNGAEKQKKVNERIKELREIIKNETSFEDGLLEREDFDSEEDYSEYLDMVHDPVYKEMFGKVSDKGKEAEKELSELLKKNSSEDDARAKIEAIRKEESKKQIEEFKNNWKSTISEDVKQEYEGFEKDTHTSHYQDLYEKGKAHIVEMSPEEYLHWCAHNIFPKQGYNSTYESQIRAAIGDAGNVMKLVNLMKSGTKMYMPILNFKDSEQEGRHRAVAAMILGIKRIPVMVVR